LDLLIDDREDSSLLKYLSVYEFSTTSCRLDFGDATFSGNGPFGEVLIGIERKRLGDLVQSMQDRRLSGHQLVGMRNYYDFLYLCVEELWRPDHNGGIEVFRSGRFVPLTTRADGCTYRQVTSYLNSLSIMGGVHILHSSGQLQTAAIYASLVHWWDKPWTSHHSHDVIYAPGPHELPGKATPRRDANMVELIASQLPGIDRKAWAVGAHFPTVADMLLASESEWMQIDGIGPETARKVTLALYGKGE
jgi:ERCC4-type nuclease